MEQRVEYIIQADVSFDDSGQWSDRIMSHDSNVIREKFAEYTSNPDYTQKFRLIKRVIRDDVLIS